MLHSVMSIMEMDVTKVYVQYIILYYQHNTADLHGRGNNMIIVIIIVLSFFVT